MSNRAQMREGVSISRKAEGGARNGQGWAWVVRGVAFVAIAWIAAGLGANMVLAAQAPVTSEHLHLASWLGQRGHAVHFTGGPMGTLLMVGLMIGALAMAARRSLGIVCLMTAAVGACGSISLSEEAYVRLGLLEGTVKLGCYVEQSTECMRQLGIVKEGSPSRYMPEGTSYEAWQWSDWYRAERAKVVSPEMERKALLTTLPGATVILAPLHAFEGARLEQMLTNQLQEALKRRSELAAAR